MDGRKACQAVLAPRAYGDLEVAVCCSDSPQALSDGGAHSRAWLQGVKKGQGVLDKAGRMLEALYVRECLVDDSC